MKKLLILSLFTLSSSLFSLCYAQGTWKSMKNAAPDSNGGVMFLLTNGTVMCLTESSTIRHSGGIGNEWDLLTPDNTGSYINGTWTKLAAMSYTRLYCSTEMFPDGNVIVAGGEYGTAANTGTEGELYNTVTNTWTESTGIPSNWEIYDGNSEMLYDGTVLQGVQVTPEFYSTGNCISNAQYHESTNTYDSVMQCFGSHDEQCWVKLPDSSIMNIDMGTEQSERYIPQQKKWVHDANLPIYINDLNLYETGAGFLLPNGKLFFLGDSVYTAIYTPTGNTSPGSWIKGPQMPKQGSTQLGCPDAPSAMMPNGKILCDFSPAGTYNNPCYFYTFDYTTNTFTQVDAPAGGLTLNDNSDFTNMLDLPDGTVMFGHQGQNRYYEFTPSTGPLAAGQPTIDNIIMDCPTFIITGTLFNGISEGAGYGDDWQPASNYPIVRLSNGTNTYYAKTTDWNRIGAVMTGSLMDTAHFTIPTGLAAGTYSVTLVANGNPSAPYVITLPCVSTDIPQTALEHHYMSVYPNPNKGIFTLESSIPIDKSIVEIDNMLGQQLLKMEMTGPKNQVNLQGQPAGVYFYRVLDDSGNLLGNGKFVIQK